MKKLIFISVFVVSASLTNAQDKYANTYACTKGKVHFFSSTKLEDIEATTNSAVCVLNTETKKVYAKITINTFSFKNKTMQEHFNENYLESDKYPAAVLDMVIVEDLDFKKDGTYDVTLKGTLEIHGVKQNREIKGKLTIKNGVPTDATAAFDVKLVDHKIDVPKVVVFNIAEVIKVDAAFVFEKYQKK